MLTLEQQYEAIQTAQELLSSTDENLKAHAQFCVNNERGYFKYALTYTEGSYKGSSLWICNNTTFTVRPEYLC